MLEYIASPLQFSEIELKKFLGVLKKRKYKVVTTVPKKEIILSGIDQEFKEEATYAGILKDTQAFVRYFSLQSIRI